MGKVKVKVLGKECNCLYKEYCTEEVHRVCKPEVIINRKVHFTFGFLKARNGRFTALNLK